MLCTPELEARLSCSVVPAATIAPKTLLSASPELFPSNNVAAVVLEFSNRIWPLPMLFHWFRVQMVCPLTSTAPVTPLLIWKPRLMFKAEPLVTSACHCIVLLPAKVNWLVGEAGVAPKLGPWDTPTTPDKLVIPVKLLPTVRFTNPEPLLLMMRNLLPLMAPPSVSVLPDALLTVRLSPKTNGVVILSPALVEIWFNCAPLPLLLKVSVLPLLLVSV